MAEVKEDVVFSLRISGELNERIQTEAEKQKRSRQAQIEYSLEEIFTNENGKKERKK